MKYGIVDLGTNSVRFDVHEVLDSGKIRRLYRDKVMVRLGEGVFETSELQDQAIDRTMSALKDFKKEAERIGVEKVLAVATSALREANNRDQFLSSVKSQTGFEINVISGRKEAELILEGIMANDAMAIGNFGFVDIGGGSTEIGVCRKKKIQYLESFNLGSARLQQMFLSGQMTRAKIQELRDFVRSEFARLMPEKDLPEIEYALGASGTIKALARILRKEGGGRKIAQKKLQELVTYMIPLRRNELLKIPGLEEKRVDLIVPGAVLLDECMSFLGVKKVFHTRYALRDGLFHAEIED